MAVFAPINVVRSATATSMIAVVSYSEYYMTTVVQIEIPAMIPTTGVHTIGQYFCRVTLTLATRYRHW